MEESKEFGLHATFSAELFEFWHHSICLRLRLSRLLFRQPHYILIKYLRYIFIIVKTVPRHFFKYELLILSLKFKSGRTRVEFEDWLLLFVQLEAWSLSLPGYILLQWMLIKLNVKWLIIWAPKYWWHDFWSQKLATAYLFKHFYQP